MPTRPENVAMPRVAGGLFVVASVGFLLVFSWLASHFGYPDVLDRPAHEVLPALQRLGDRGRVVWALYAVLPLFLVPAVALSARALLENAHDRPLFDAALGLQVISSLSMAIGLARWSTLQWELAERAAQAAPTTREAIHAVSDALNRYLGNGLGEFVGELALYGVFAVLTLLLWRGRTRRLALLGAVTTVAGWAGMFRNVTAAVEVAAAVSNVLLPAFLIALGVWLMRAHRPRDVA